MRHSLLFFPGFMKLSGAKLIFSSLLLISVRCYEFHVAYCEALNVFHL